jgi:hypothetical protein
MSKFAKFVGTRTGGVLWYCTWCAVSCGLVFVLQHLGLR